MRCDGRPYAVGSWDSFRESFVHESRSGPHRGPGNSERPIKSYMLVGMPQLLPTFRDLGSRRWLPTSHRSSDRLA